MPSDDPPLPSIGRLQWHCRRGMLELDYLLRDFLDRRYQALDAPRQRDFVRLLDYPDQILHDWLLGNSVPRDPRLQSLVNLMRAPH